MGRNKEVQGPRKASMDISSTCLLGRELSDTKGREFEKAIYQYAHAGRKPEKKGSIRPSGRKELPEHARRRESSAAREKGSWAERGCKKKGKKLSREKGKALGEITAA